MIGDKYCWVLTDGTRITGFYQEDQGNHIRVSDPKYLNQQYDIKPAPMGFWIGKKHVTHFWMLAQEEQPERVK